MKRSLIPKSIRDRLILIGGCFLAVLTIWAARIGDYGWALYFGFSTAASLIHSYILQDQITLTGNESEYSAVIEKIGLIGKQLSELSKFLEKERARVADTEATVRKLKDEQTKLEPLVHTQRETVEAILAAHSERTARHSWKERLLGFLLGVIASLIASFVYGYFKQ